MRNKLSLPLLIQTTPVYFASLMVVLVLFFFVPGILILFSLGAARPSNENPQTHVIVGAVFCLIGLMAAASAPFLHRGRPRIFLRQDGIETPQYSRDFIPWSSINSIRVKSVRGTKFICLYLKNNSQYRMTRVSQLNKTFGFGDINISTSGTGVDFEDAKTTIEELVEVASLNRT